jgi:hypothetical protein
MGRESEKEMSPLFEIGYHCGCKFANYNKSVLVKLCAEHYEKCKNMTVEQILMERLQQKITFVKGKK